MAFLYYPEALNQHPLTIIDEGRIILIFGLPIGCVGYVWTFGAQMVYAAFAKRLPVRFINNASMFVGVAFLAILPLYQLPLILFGLSIPAGIMGIVLVLLDLVAAITVAVCIVRHNSSSQLQ